MKIHKIKMLAAFAMALPVGLFPWSLLALPVFLASLHSEAVALHAMPVIGAITAMCALLMLVLTSVLYQGLRNSRGGRR